MANKRERVKVQGAVKEKVACLLPCGGLAFLIPDASLMDLDLLKRYHKCRTPEEPNNACNPCT